MLATFLLFSTLLQSPPPPDRSKQQNPSQGGHQSTEHPDPPALVQDKQNHPAYQKSPSENQTEKRPEKPPWWDPAWSTIGLVVIGFLAPWLPLGLCALSEGRLLRLNPK